jgi:hypothetical protein
MPMTAHGRSGTLAAMSLHGFVATRAPMRALACLLAGAALLAGCGGDDEPAGSTDATRPPPAETTATVPATTAVPEGVDPLEGASDQPAVGASENTDTALLTAVRAARHEGYDRVVFEFADDVPGYDVRYADGPVQADGSGDEVPVDGAHVVVVRMENALDADLSEPDAPMTYTGPARLSPSTPEVSELVRVGGFEGVLTWAVGLADRVDFRVTTLTGPPRLVIDFRNH